MQSPNSRPSSRGSYPSKQPRFGLAPLASFEDLPTDEQQSSSSSDEERRNSVITRQPNITFVITDHDEENALDTIPAEKVSLLCQENVATKDNFSNPTCLTNVSKRKSSWADFFSLRKSPTPSKTKERKFSLFNFNFFSKEYKKSEANNFIDNFEMKVSIRSETPESIENHSELSELVQISSNCNENDSTVPVDECLSATPTSSVAETVIVQIEHEPKGQNDETDSKTVTDTDSRSTSSLSVCSMENCPGVVDSSCCEVECEECAQQYSCDCSQDTDCCDAADNEDNDEDIGEPHIKFYDSYELDLLLKGDELELNNRFGDEHIEHFPPHVVQDTSKEEPKCNLKLSLEKLKTSPIERPRSITPINIECFEAFINQPMPCSNNEDTCDKLTITLPGVSSNAKRNRLSRKSNPFIWQEFCEKGLRSPLVLRKRANSCFPQISQNYFFNDAFEVNGDSPGDLTPITPLNELNSNEEDLQETNGSPWASGGLCNTLVDTQKSGLSKRTEYARSNKDFRSEVNCSCDCNCSTSVTNALSLTTCSEITSEVTSDENDSNSFDGTSQTEPTNSENHEDQPLVSPCDCTCHHNTSVLNRLMEESTCEEEWHGTGSESSPTVSSSSPTSVSPITEGTTSSPSASSWTTSQSARLLDSSTASNL